MTVAFSDTFNRSDGPPGGDWTVESGTWAIDGNVLKSTVAGRIRCNVAPAGVNVCAFMTVPGYSTANKTYAFRLRQSEDGTYYYLVQFMLTSSTVVVTIAEAAGGSQTTLATRTVAHTPGTTEYLMGSVCDNTILANFGSGQYLTCYAENVTLAGKVAIVTSSSPSTVDDFYLYDLSDDAWGTTIEEAVGGPPDYVLTLHNPATDWTAGTPGEPTFESKSGSITSQQVTDENTAILQYTAPDISLEDFIVDPYNGVLFPIHITNPGGASGPAGGGSGLTAEEHATLDDLAAWYADYSANEDNEQRSVFVQMGSMIIAVSSGSGTPGDNLGDSVATILSQTYGLSAIKNVVDLIYALLDATTGTGGYTLSSVQEAIRGASTRDLTQVYNLIDALEVADPTDVTEILNAIAAIRTANMWTLDSVKTWIEAIETGSNQDVLNELALIRTANMWTLGHIMDAIAAIDIPDYSTQLQNIHDDVAAIPTNPIVSLQPVLDAIAAVRGSGNPDLAALLTAINAIPTNPITSLQTVLDAISALDTVVDTGIGDILDAIDAIPTATPPPQPPVWPGLANVTMGTPVALATGVTITAPMHGVVVNLTSVPSDTEHYDFDAQLSYVHLGALAFANDDGAVEGFQPFSFGKHLLTPNRMTEASAVYVRCAIGVTGTVTPWTINAA